MLFCQQCLQQLGELRRFPWTTEQCSDRVVKFGKLKKIMLFVFLKALSFQLTPRKSTLNQTLTSFIISLMNNVSPC